MPPPPKFYHRVMYIAPSSGHISLNLKVKKFWKWWSPWGVAKTLKWLDFWKLVLAKTLKLYFFCCENDMLWSGNLGLKMGVSYQKWHIPNMHIYGSAPPPLPLGSDVLSEHTIIYEQDVWDFHLVTSKRLQTKRLSGLLAGGLRLHTEPVQIHFQYTHTQCNLLATYRYIRTW